MTLLGDLAGRRVRVVQPAPGNEDALGVEGIARYASYIDQGGLPTHEEQRELQRSRVRYHVEAARTEDISRTSGRSFTPGELEPVE